MSCQKEPRHSWRFGKVREEFHCAIITSPIWQALCVFAFEVVFQVDTVPQMSALLSTPFPCIHISFLHALTFQLHIRWSYKCEQLWICPLSLLPMCDVLNMICTSTWVHPTISSSIEIAPCTLAGRTKLLSILLTGWHVCNHTMPNLHCARGVIVLSLLRIVLLRMHSLITISKSNPIPMHG